MNLAGKHLLQGESSPAPDFEKMRRDYSQIRDLSMRLCEPLSHEDFTIQSAPEVSPPKWHLAHTSWFFETFLLLPFLKDYRVFDPQYGYLFNSYYQGLGSPYPRKDRGLMSRPTVEEVFAYRRHVDAAMEKLLNGPELSSRKDGSSLLELGLHHEQQHQELLLMDIKHIFWSNALRPVYRLRAPSWQREPPLLEWLSVPEGIYQIGAESSGFAFDNERPRHRVFLENFKLASRPVTNGEYLEFIGDGGYQNPLLWLSDGWDLLQNERWRAPLYWEQNGEGWRHMTLSGMREVDPREPVSHLSYYEADAYARWAGKRLPREAEWEVVAGEQEVQGNFLESGIFHPQSPLSDSGPFPWQLFGDVWEWTQSPYGPYPKFKPLSGALGEYNGKFMCNQMVLRGGCCWTPRSHARATYRNFFPPQSRWQCSGLRLAEDG